MVHAHGIIIKYDSHAEAAVLKYTQGDPVVVTYAYVGNLHAPL